MIGNRELWRIDPTGQFYDCHAVFIGNGSEKAETQLYGLLKERLGNGDGEQNFENVFGNMEVDEAVKLALQCIKKSIQGSPENRLAFSMIPTVYWQGLIMEYAKDSAISEAPRRRFLKGRFSPTMKAAE